MNKLLDMASTHVMAMKAKSSYRLYMQASVVGFIVLTPLAPLKSNGCKEQVGCAGIVPYFYQCHHYCYYHLDLRHCIFRHKPSRFLNYQKFSPQCIKMFHCYQLL